jgi:hypothetical protein
MSNQMNITEDSWYVEQFVEDYNLENTGSLYLPASQRQWAWKHARGLAKQQRLIDSVMNGYPIPTCILNRVSTSLFEIYDGRHRIETLWHYANDKFKWNGKLFSELTQDEKDRFNNRKIPVTIVRRATLSQLADIFMRLNNGVALTDSDYFWACRDRNLIRAVERLVMNNDRLKAALGGVDLKYRKDLANWVAHVYGLATRKSGDMTTSYIRIAEDGGLDVEVDDEYVKAGLDALCTIYETANSSSRVAEKDKKALKKIGRIAAFALAEWMDDEKYPNKQAVIAKWVGIVIRHRMVTEDGMRMRQALTTSGAQNLNSTKITKVLEQVNRFVDSGISTGDDFGSDDESSE